ncbi:helix-turn-helix domain-containing protein [Nonomuraea sp. NPDC050383]|uniref:helix-turn-helix domain-containing protein n=1 Tax=Nonomuraea sp. NPDC050383 TaxID=3364362 RepID=UPI0037A8A4C6
MGRREEPIDPGAGPLAAFALDLRRLRESAGSPSYRQLARTAHYSASALSSACSGNSMPSWNVTRALVQACGGDVGQWQQRWRQVAAELCREPEAAHAGQRDAERAAVDPSTPIAATSEDTAPGVSSPDGASRPAPMIWKPHTAVVASVALIGVVLFVLIGRNAQSGASQPADPATPAPPTMTASPSGRPTPAGTATTASSTQAAPAVGGDAGPATVSSFPPDGGVVVGPGCPLDKRRDYSINEQHDDGWHPATGGWTGDGCTGRMFYTALAGQTTPYAYPLRWKESFVWRAVTGVAGPARCALAVHVPDSSYAAAVAIYRLHRTSNADGDSIADLPVDQAAHHGSWLVHHVSVPDATDLSVELVDTGPGDRTIAADAISMACPG